MKAVRVHRFGPPEVMLLEEIPMPQPAPDEVLVKVAAAGVGPWDAWIRSGHSALSQSLPLTLGSDFAGTIESVGRDVSSLRPGQNVFGVTNPYFTGAYAEYCLAKAAMLSPMPVGLSSVRAAAAPVIAVTAWQMLVDHAQIQIGQSVLILGAAGNVGSIAVQLAHRLHAQVVAVIAADHSRRLSELGASEVITFVPGAFAHLTDQMDAVIDTVGGVAQTEAIATLKPGGTLISAVSEPDHTLLASKGARGKFFLVDVKTAELTQIAQLLSEGALQLNVGTVLPLSDARIAHEMLDGRGAKPRGKIVLDVEGN